jgi:predicted nuclease of predicted toxin-antitoxin system
MRFVVDANLPSILVGFFRARGHEGVHVGSLELGQSALDSEIARWAEENDAVVVSKDDDFRLPQVATGRPPRLLLVGTGNISNKDLVALFEMRADEIETALAGARCVEVLRGSLIVDVIGDS